MYMEPPSLYPRANTLRKQELLELLFPGNLQRGAGQGRQDGTGICAENSKLQAVQAPAPPRECITRHPGQSGNWDLPVGSPLSCPMAEQLLRPETHRAPHLLSAY